MRTSDNVEDNFDETGLRSEGRVWAAILKMAKKRWQLKLMFSFLIVFLTYGVQVWVAFVFDNFLMSVKMPIWMPAFIWSAGMAYLFVLWMGGGSEAESFLKIDMESGDVSVISKPLVLYNDSKVMAVLMTDGQVRYYPVGSKSYLNMKFDEYISSQVAEVERLSLKPEDIAFAAQQIDMMGVIKYFNRRPVVEVAKSSLSSNAKLTAEEEVRKPVYISSFVKQIESVLVGLDKRILNSEKKASLLLDVGRSYLRRGIVWYVVSIIAWQVLFFSLNYQWSWAFGVGIFSCSLAFIVVEFLAAWFLKQYRHYGDSIQVYLTVRSTFERYLLSYYVVNEYSEVEGDGDKCRAEMLRVLSEEIKWPDIKDTNSNDFNYMMKSMGSVVELLDKLKGVNTDGLPGRRNN
ncbi:hypothetical protein [Pseudomonas aeruginosa]|uniref:hypothetical protein n=1 Tax=Pseudomonas aeruginosa TaxID=287 RepID=UPI00396AEA3B